MNLDDLKKKAGELTKDFQENVLPEIKEKTKKAKDNVVEFVGDKFGHKDEASDADNIVNTETDIAERVEADIVEVNAAATEAAKNTEAEKEALDRVEKSAKSDSEAAEASDKSEDSKKCETEVGAKTADKPDEGPKTEKEAGAEVSDESEESTKDEKKTGVEAADTDIGEVEHVSGTVDAVTLKDKYAAAKAELLPKVKKTTGSVVDTLSPKVKSAAAVVGETAKNVASTVGEKIKTTASELTPKIKESFQETAPKVKKTIKEAGPKLKKTVKNAADDISFQGYRVRKTAKKKTGDAIKNSIRNAVFPNGDKASANDNKTVKNDAGDSGKKKPFKEITDSSAYKHAKTVISHRHLVLEHCIKAGIPLQGLTHDLSKFSPSEFFYGIKFFSGDRSPNEGEREDHGYSNAWMHHKGRNKHHFEYWIDYNIEANKAMPVKMPLKYLIEMFCDRVAASKVYLKDKYTDQCPLQYFEKGRTRRNIHPETSDFLEKLLKMLAKKGEDYTFMYIKWFMKHHDDY